MGPKLQRVRGLGNKNDWLQVKKRQKPVAKAMGYCKLPNSSYSDFTAPRQANRGVVAKNHIRNKGSTGLGSQLVP